MAEAEPEEVCVEPLRDLTNLEILRDIQDPEHWFNYIWSLPENAIAYNVLDTGMPLMDFLRRPTPIVENFEWLAFVIHGLIDRVSIFYDFVVLRCNDGFRQLNFTKTLFYGSEITLKDLEPGVENLLKSDNEKCAHRIKIGDDECIPVDMDVIHDFPMLNFPPKVQDGHYSFLGASSYINAMIEKLKELRENRCRFPCSVDYYVTPTFEGVTRYILFHLANIMSHITTCHFKEIADQKLNRHLFTLNAWIFSIGVHYDFLPPTNNISSEFVALCRHLLYVDTIIERSPRPMIPPIPVEGAPELPEESSDESDNSNVIKISKTFDEAVASDKIVEDINVLGKKSLIAPEAMNAASKAPLIQNLISQKNCNVGMSIRSPQQKRSQNKNRKKNEKGDKLTCT